jgi:hypothetical protein
MARSSGQTRTGAAALDVVMEGVMDVIETGYMCPTETLGSRVRAVTAAIKLGGDTKKREVLDWNYDKTVVENHDDVARLLMQEGLYARGEAPSGKGFIYVVIGENLVTKEGKKS